MKNQKLKKSKKVSGAALFFKRSWIYAVLFASMGSLSACNEDEDVIAIDDPSDSTEVFATFEEAIKSGGVPERVEKMEEVIDSTETEELREDGSLWMCKVTTVSIEDGNSDFPLFNPNASVIYPGSLLQGKTLTNASPSIIPVKRGGGTISIDIIDGSEQPAFTVDEVTKSSIATAANQIIGSSSGTIPANFNLEYEEISSEEHLAFGLGLDVKSQYVSMGVDFEFTQDESYNHFLVKLNQSFYTLSFDIPTSYGDLFASDISPGDLAPYVGPGNPVTFISDVTYGRIYYMLIESTSSSLDIKSKIQASFEGGVTSADLEASADYFSSLKDLRIKVLAFGGEAKSSFNSIGNTNITELATLFGESSDIRTGVPISYVVRDAVNKETVGVKLATEYDIKECTPIASALGSPVIMYSAESFDETSPAYCAECIEYNGKYRYYPPNDSFAREYEGKHDGKVANQWPDLSADKTRPASAIANEPDSRPMIIDDAFDNGLPALEFFRGHVYEYTYNRMTYSGGVFANTDYTIFAVLAHPESIKVEWKDSDGHWGIRVNKPNSFGYFMRGNNTEMYKQLLVGFQNSQLFRFSHSKYSVTIDDPEFSPKANFQVYAFRFSQEEGMSVYVNGELIKKDSSKKLPLLSYEGATIGAGYPGSDYGFSRVRIGEFRGYTIAATEAQIKEETRILNEKYGL